MTDHHPDCTADHRAAVGNPVFTDSRDGMEKCVMCIVATKAERRGVKAAREAVAAAYEGHFTENGVLYRDADPATGLRALDALIDALEKP